MTVTIHAILKAILNYLRDASFVFIGAVLAIYATDWYESNQKDELERNILSEIKYDLELDLNNLKTDIENNEARKKSNEIVLNFLASNAEFTDSLSSHFASIFGNTILTTNTSGYENLKSIGFDIISNDSIWLFRSDHASDFGVTVPL